MRLRAESMAMPTPLAAGRKVIAWLEPSIATTSLSKTA
jgi:hypothetical protein